METEDYIILYDQLFNTEGYSQDYVGEKDFFEFMKRANRDLTPHQRFVVLTITINAIREGEDNVKKTNTER